MPSLSIVTTLHTTWGVNTTRCVSCAYCLYIVLFIVFIEDCTTVQDTVMTTGLGRAVT